MKSLLNALEEIDDHPYNLIGLADREKFHTGMLAYTINWLRKKKEENEEELKELIAAIWNEAIAQQFAENSHFKVEIEYNSLDLAISDGKNVIAFAEVKVKSLLNKGQIKKYKSKLEKQKALKSKGVVIGIFNEKTHDPEVDSKKFTDIICKIFEGYNFGSCRRDELTIIKLWVEYLSAIKCAVDRFEQKGTEGFEEDFETSKNLENQLREIKLLGIFGAYRCRKILESVDKNLFLETKHFNTHGAAGIDFILDRNEEIVTGFQYQNNYLKFFASIDKNKKSPISTSLRDKILNNAIKELNKSVIDENSKYTGSGNSNNYFRSTKLEQINLFGDLTGFIEKLKDYRKDLELIWKIHN